MILIIKGIPLQKQSARFVRRGNFIKSYQPSKIVNWVSQVKIQLLQQLPEDFIPFSKEVKIKKLLYIFPPLKSFTKKKMKQIELGETIYKSTKPDLDNLQKNLFDSCNGIVWVDDARIVKIESISKIYGLIPQIILEVEE